MVFSLLVFLYTGTPNPSAHPLAVPLGHLVVGLLHILNELPVGFEEITAGEHPLNDIIYLKGKTEGNAGIGGTEELGSGN
jgi:hypothetical protein